MRRRAWATVLGVGFLQGAAASAQGIAQFRDDTATIEAGVLDALNQVRTDPASYAAKLRTYRSYFHDKLVSMPGADNDIETVEGIVPVDEAIALLDKQRPLKPIALGSTLRAGALDHVRDQGVTGATGHFDSKGLGPGQRNQKHGGGKQIAEVIAYGAATAIEVVRELIVDDGVSDRGHRVVMFAGHLRYAGIACGPHPVFGTMCVIDFSDTPDGNG